MEIEIRDGDTVPWITCQHPITNYQAKRLDGDILKEAFEMAKMLAFFPEDKYDFDTVMSGDGSVYAEDQISHTERENLASTSKASSKSKSRFVKSLLGLK